jgi:1-phosphofructokinase family hexose kinase
MILVVSLNPALDITHHVAGVDWSGVNRPQRVSTAPGGKGLNVARTLHALGADVRVAGLAGGIVGEAVAAWLAAAGVAGTFAPIAGQTRRTFAVVDTASHDTALFNEPGPAVTAGEYQRFLVLYENSLAGCDAVVLSGSLPPGLPEDSYAGLAARAAAAAVPVMLDAGGATLRRGVAAGPAIAKPNLAELQAAVRRQLAGLAAIAAAAAELRAAGARAVVVSLGRDGLLAVTGEGTWHATPPAQMTGNPTGAGDAVVAGLVHGLVLARPWAERLRHAAALGTACVAAPGAGQFAEADYRRALAGTQVTEWADR